MPNQNLILAFTCKKYFDTSNKNKRALTLNLIFNFISPKKPLFVLQRTLHLQNVTFVAFERIEKKVIHESNERRKEFEFY